jgi:hypothetical protein
VAGALVVEHYTERTGFRPEEFAGHSLRAGFLTSNAEAIAPAVVILNASIRTLQFISCIL